MRIIPSWIRDFISGTDDHVPEGPAAGADRGGEPRSITANDLIPELKQWNNGEGITADGWIACVGDYEHLIGYAQLLWPDFLEHDGCTFLAANFDEKYYRNWMKTCKRNRKSVEMVVNHQHIVDIFPNVQSDLTEDVILYIGRLLKQTWAAKLKQDFPSKNFSISFPEDDITDLTDYEITFFEDR
jgi:hypothetical protein